MMLILEMTSLKNFLKKLEKEAACGSKKNPTSLYIPEGNERMISNRYLYFHVQCSIIHSSNIWNQYKCSLMDE